MILNKEYIQKLVSQRGWSQTEFAKRLCMSRAEVNRFFSGKRKGGTKLAGNIIRVFSSEALEDLFFLDRTLPEGRKCYVYCK